MFFIVIFDKSWGCNIGLLFREGVFVVGFFVLCKVFFRFENFLVLENGFIIYRFFIGIWERKRDGEREGVYVLGVSFIYLKGRDFKIYDFSYLFYLIS